MSSISFTFDLSRVPAMYQPVFMARFSQLTTEYQILCNMPLPPVSAPLEQQSPPAEELPAPSSFQPLHEEAQDGEGSHAASSVETSVKKPRMKLTEAQKTALAANLATIEATTFASLDDKLAAIRKAKRTARKMSRDSLEEAAPAPAPATDKYENMTAQQLRGELADRQGLSREDPKRVHMVRFPRKKHLIAELRRLDVETVTSATASATALPVEIHEEDYLWDDEPLGTSYEEAAETVTRTRAVLEAAVAAEKASETLSESTSKKSGRNSWANLTPGERKARIEKGIATRKQTMERLKTLQAESRSIGTWTSNE